jgi:hypothetical protein
VIDSQGQTVLQDTLQRESRSVLMYMAEATPWADSTEDKARATLQQAIAEERQAIVALGRFLLRQHVPLPYIGSYPESFTTINFIALDYLWPRLIEHERSTIARLERDLAALRDPLARAEVEKLLAVKRRVLSALETVSPRQPQASPA